MSYWIDSHAHMVSEGMIEHFKDLKVRCIEENVKKVLIICGSLEQVESALSLTQDDDMFDLAIGVHPTTVHERTQDEFLSMMDYLDHPKVVALGEIGLDYYWDESHSELQKEMLVRQIEIANEKNLPIIVHLRSSHEDLSSLLKDHPVNQKGVIHCFSEDVEAANLYLDMGFYLGFGGILTFKNGDNVRDVLAITPLNRILSETDSPYLAPVPKRGKKNEPSYVAFVGESISNNLERPASLIQNAIINNYKRLFKKTSL